MDGRDFRATGIGRRAFGFVSAPAARRFRQDGQQLLKIDDVGNERGLVLRKKRRRSEDEREEGDNCSFHPGK